MTKHSKKWRTSGAMELVSKIDQLRHDLIMKLLSEENYNSDVDYLDRFDEGIKVGRYKLAQELLEYLNKEWKINIEVN